MMPSVLWENFIRTPAVLCSFLLPTLKSLQLDTELTLSVSDILLINYQFACVLIVYIASLMVLMVLRTVSSNFNFLVTYLHRFFLYAIHTHRVLVCRICRFGFCQPIWEFDHTHCVPPHRPGGPRVFALIDRGNRGRELQETSVRVPGQGHDPPSRQQCSHGHGTLKVHSPTSTAKIQTLDSC